MPNPDYPPDEIRKSQEAHMKQFIEKMGIVPLNDYNNPCAIVSFQGGSFNIKPVKAEEIYENLPKPQDR